MADGGATDGGKVAREHLELGVRASLVRVRHPLDEFLERQPSFGRGVAQLLDGSVALGVGGANCRDVAHVSSCLYADSTSWSKASTACIDAATSGVPMLSRYAGVASRG